MEKSKNPIVTIDPYSKRVFLYKNNELKTSKLDKFKKSHFYISYIYTKDVISASIEISQNIPEEDLKDVIEIKAYEELGLDSATEYKILYFETSSTDEKNRHFNVSAINKALLEKDFEEIKKKIKYIDYITPAPFLLKSLYDKEILERESTDCFIYFQEEDTFLALYKDGEYIYSKSIQYSLKTMNEKFCEYVGERIEEREFYDLIVNEGLKSSNFSYQQALMKLYGEIFLYISDVLSFAKRAYNIEYINKLYIGSQIGLFMGIDEYSKNYLELDSLEFKFNIPIKASHYIDQLHYLMVLTAQVYQENLDDTYNISPFKRPPSFKHRPAGKLLMVTVISAVLSMLYPLYQIGYTAKLKYDLNKINQKYSQIYAKTSKLREELAKLSKKKEEVLKIYKEEKNKLTFREKLLNEIYRKKVSYPMKAVILSDLFQNINRYDTKVLSVDNNMTNLTLTVYSKKDKKITELMKALAKESKYDISTEEIKRDGNKSVYISDVKVRLNEY